MPSTRHALTLVVATLVAMTGCKPAGPAASTGGQGDATLVRGTDRIAAGGAFPAANALSAPRPAELNPDAGAALFGAMNCDGCHGGGAVGWVGPSLVDGRWRYSGADDQIFTSIFYGRPKGMPAYGGVIGSDGVWMLVAYLKAQGTPSVVPTTSWLAGGNASPNPTPAAAAAPAAVPAPAKAISVAEMPARYGCTGCHAIDRKVVGPAFKEVANKYRGQDVEAKLVAKVRSGGSGVWGQIAMIPNPHVPEESLQAMVKWVLALK